MPNQGDMVTDGQTGQAFALIPERWFDVLAAWISVAYSLAVIAYLAWLVLDTWSGQYSAWFMRPIKGVLLGQLVDENVFKLVVYTAIGGGMGASVNNVRGFIQWHAERQAFGWRFVWKYLALPPLGATLAVLVYGILQSGIAVMNGGALGRSAITSFSAWATGTLAGYGSHKVFIWLDDKVNSLFKVEIKKVKVPDVIGKTPEEAKQILIDSKLAVGDTSKAETSDPQVGKVIGQSPSAGTEIACDSKVSITIGIPSGIAEPDEVTATRPDLAGKPEEEAKQIVQNGKLSQPSETATEGTTAT